MHIKSHTVGLIFRVLQLVVIAYVIGYAIGLLISIGFLQLLL